MNLVSKVQGRQFLQTKQFEEIIDLATKLPIMQRGTDVAGVLRQIADAANAALGGSFCVVQPYDEKQDKFLLNHFTAGGSAKAIAFEWREPRTNGLARTTLREGLLKIEDYEKESRTRPTLTRASGDTKGAFRDIEEINACLGIRLEAGGEKVGVLFVNYPTAHHFKEADIASARLFGNQAAIAIWNARLYQERVEYAEQLTTLDEITREINSTLDLERQLDLISKHLINLVGAKRSLFLSVNPNTRKVELAKGYGYSPRHLSEISYNQIETGLSGWVLQEGRSILSENAQSDPRQTGMSLEIARQLNTGSVIVTPLNIKGTVSGTLTVVNDKDDPPFDNEDLSLVERLANQAAIAIGNAQTYDSERRARQLSDKIREIAVPLSAAQDLSGVYRLTIEQAREIVNYDGALLMMVEGRRLVSKAAFGFEDLEAVLSFTLPADEDIVFHEIESSTQPVILTDVKADARWKPVPSVTWVRGWMGVPLLSKERVIGQIGLYRKETDSFTTEDARAVSQFATLAASAIDNARFIEQIRTLSAIQSEILAKAIDLDQIIHLILSKALDLVGAEIGQVLLLEPEEQLLRISASTGGDEGLSLNVNDSVTGLVVSQKTPLLVSDISESENFRKLYKYFDSPSRSELAVPLIVGDEIIGVLNVESRYANAFDEYHKDLLVALANATSSAIVTARAAVRELDIVGEVQKEILAESFDLNNVFRAVVSQALMTTNAQSGEMLLVEGDFLRDVAITSPSSDRPAKLGPIPIHDSVSGLAVLRKQPILVGDLDNEPDYRQFYKPVLGQRMKSELVVPLLMNNDAIGVINVESEVPYKFSRHHVDLLQALADSAAVAIRAAQNHAELVRRRREQETIAKIQEEILNSAFDRETVFNLILHRGLEQVNSTIGQFLLVEGEELVVYASTYGPDIKRARVSIDRSVTGLAVKSKRPVRAANVRTEEPFKSVYQPILADTLHSELAVPLIVADTVIGVLNVEDEGIGAFTEDDERLLSEIARQAALGLRLTEAFADIGTLSDIQDRILSGHLSPEEASLLTLTEAAKLIGAETGQILNLKDPNTLTIIASTNAGDVGTEVNVYDSVSGFAIIENEPVNVYDVTQQEPYKSKYKKFLGPEMYSELVVPLKLRERTIGVLNFESPRRRAFTEHHVDLVYMLAGQFAMAIRVAEQLEIEKKARESEKLAAVGEKSGDIVHRLASPTAVMRERLGRIRTKRADLLASDEFLAHQLDDFDRNILKIQAMVRELKEESSEELGPVDVWNLIVQVERRVDKPDNISIVHLDDKAPIVRANAKLGDVLYNLLTNAIEAITEARDTGGEIKIDTEFVNNGGFVEISVHDNGVGIPSYLRDQLFNAGTPSHKGQGRGLGLWWSRAYVEKCGGELDFESKIGEGSRFFIRLPVARAQSKGQV